ncbi:MAG: hypothetical protein ABJN75_18690 [Hoeflea sp.]|uniref:hypothetical protein n=1 Tax=Hoeflea sp. TaxID=1940281 RepID=UPI003298BA64|tara:strand:+ start:28588 stop:28752 length:165 start_codon:yes stop_codon:yes gene_type:complete
MKQLLMLQATPLEIGMAAISGLVGVFWWPRAWWDISGCHSRSGSGLSSSAQALH